MRKKIQAIGILLTLSFFPYFGYSQCRDFVKEKCIQHLDDYIHDGHYNATSLEAGEEADLFKTFFKGQEYRIVVAGSEEHKQIEFTVIDIVGNVVYSSRKNNHSLTWDFTPKHSQKLIISIHVPQFKNKKKENGCVAVLVGLKGF
jgi:hypothetical protein